MGYSTALKCLSHQNGFLLIRIEQKKLLNKFFIRFCFKLLVPELQRLKVTIFAIFWKKAAPLGEWEQGTCLLLSLSNSMEIACLSRKKTSFFSEKLKFLDQIQCQVKAATLLTGFNIKWKMNNKKIGTTSPPTSFALILMQTVTWTEAWLEN